MDEQPASLRQRFEAGGTFEELLQRPKDNLELWRAIYSRAKIGDDAVARVSSLHRTWHLLVINEDWCGDSVNILPFVSRLAESTQHLKLRIIGRDDNRDLMDSHLTGASRSIPIVIVYDEQFNEKGWWGPRPAELQKWVMTEGLALPKPDRYRHIRTWYARDRGVAVMSEILSIIEGLDV